MSFLSPFVRKYPFHITTHYHTRALCHIRRLITEDAAQTIGRSMVNGRLDYCNSLLYRTSSSNTTKLTRVHNHLARIITRRRQSDYISRVLADLHWLPAQSHIQYKLAVITFNVLITQKPSYVHDQLQSHASTRQLRSGDQDLLHVYRVKSVFAERANET
jgi:hypothetical protein